MIKRNRGIICLKSLKRMGKEFKKHYLLFCFHMFLAAL